MSRFLFVLTATLIAISSGTASADSAFPPIEHDVFQRECSECHMTYQPQMLPERSWNRVMGGLDDHFGENASLDAEANRQILGYLMANAADVAPVKAARKFMRGLSAADTPLRISDMPRFRRKHRKLPSSLWADKRVRFRGNCNACHEKTESGIYNDYFVRVPGPEGTWARWED